MTLSTKRGSWEAPAKKLEEWAKAFPLADLASEALRMQAWLNEHTNRQPKNFSRFVSNWLSKAHSDAYGVSKVLTKDGAYVEPPGARPEASPRYSELYWKARDAGYSTVAAAKIALKAMDSEAPKKPLDKPLPYPSESF